MHAINGERLARLVRDLEVPVPLDLERFGGWLERRTQRRTRLIPVIMEPGGPTGALLRRSEEDCLYYEEQTSRFHQAHIVVSLAARLLLPQGEESLPAIDGVSPRLVRLMLGDTPGGMLGRGEAEAFAFLVLDQARPACPPLVARRACRQLRPLRVGVGEAVKEIHAPALDGIRSSRYRLYRQIVGIRDAALAIKGYRDLPATSAGTKAAQAAGLTGGELAAAVEAAALMSAVQGKTDGRRAWPGGGEVGLPGVGGSDLRGEAAWLVTVAPAFTRLQRAAGGSRAGVAGGSAGRQETWLPSPGVILLRC